MDASSVVQLEPGKRARIGELLQLLYLEAAQDVDEVGHIKTFLHSIVADLPRGHTHCGTEVANCLTPRERNILRLMSCGQSNKRIARELQIAAETVKSHIKNIFVKLAVQSRAHAVSRASLLKLI